MKRLFKRSKYAYRLTTTDWKNALFWLLVSVVVFSLSLPINVLKFEISTATTIFLVTIFRSLFTAIFVGIPAAIVYYGTFISAPPRDYPYVMRQVLISVPLVAYSFLYTSMFIVFLAMFGLFWTNSIYDLVPSVAALISLLFVSSRFTKVGVMENLLYPKEVDRYEKYLGGYKENTRWYKRIFGVGRRDRAQTVHFLFLSTFVGLLVVTVFFQFVVGYISPYRGMSDFLNAFMLTPTILVWYMFRALFKRRQAIQFLRSRPADKKRFRVETTFTLPENEALIPAKKSQMKRKRVA